MFFDATLFHTIVEFLSVVCYGAIAFFAYKRLIRTEDNFNMYWLFGFTIAALIIVVHAVVGQFDLASHASWIPATWAIERGVLLLMLYCAMITGYLVKYGSVIVISCLSLLVATLMAFPELGINSGQVVQDHQPYRPVDFVLMLSWMGLWAIFWMNRVQLAAHDLPPFFHWFVLLGIIVHGIMAFFSPVPFDNAFMIAHVLKLVEAGVWAVAFYQWEKRLHLA